MQIELIGEEFREPWKWRGCTMGHDGCLYAVPFDADYILKIDPTNDSTTLVGRYLFGEQKWNGGVLGPDGMIYGIPFNANHILKYYPALNLVAKVGGKLGDVEKYNDCAAVVTNTKIYLFPSCESKIIRYDPVNQSRVYIDAGQHGYGWRGSILAGDGCVYALPSYNAHHVLRFDPISESVTFIGDDFQDFNEDNWRGTVLGADGNVYAIPYNHNRVLKIDILSQSISLVGPDLGKGLSKFESGVVGFDKCIYMIPRNAEFVLKFDPVTGIATTIGESLGDARMKSKYSGGALSPTGYIYVPPFNAKQVLKIKTWNNWFYLKLRLLAERERAKSKYQCNNDLKIIQHFIICVNDDIFQTILDML